MELYRFFISNMSNSGKLQQITVERTLFLGKNNEDGQITHQLISPGASSVSLILRDINKLGTMFGISLL